MIPADITFKQKAYALCTQALDEKIQALRLQLQELQESATNETKSTAGDKHETALAMLQIEQETIQHRLHDTAALKSELEKINISRTSSQIRKGSLVKTNRGYFFIAIGLGRIVADEIPVIVISPQSPLGAKLTGASVHTIVKLNESSYTVEAIC